MSAPDEKELRPTDASNEPLEVKLIAAASDGLVNVTPEKCERIRELLLAERERLREEYDVRGENAWLDELVDCDGHRDKLRTVLRAFAANLETNRAIGDKGAK